MDKIIETAIQGVFVAIPKVIASNGGCVLKMLLPDSPLLPNFCAGFGELYFSEINPGIVRAWKRHHRQTQLLAVPMGKIALGLHDGRPESPTYGKSQGLILGRPDNYQIVRIPPGIWYGFGGLAKSPSLICNLADIPHDPTEILRAPANGSEAPFPWNKLWPDVPTPTDNTDSK